MKAAIDEHAIVAITDPRGKITYVNDKFCAISKYSREELLGQDHRIINSGYHPKAFIRDIWQTIGSGRVWKGEIKNKAKDGSFYWVDTTIVPYLGEDGKPLQYIAIRADITERKQAEAALQKAQGELQEHASTLEETVETRTAALRETIGELEAFSYSVSHDMRAPLRAMQSFSKILGEDCGDQVSPKGKEYIRRISTAAARMDSLIQDVLTYSRVSRIDLPMQPVNVEAMLREILETYPAFQAPTANVELQGDFPTVMAIPAVLTQCISNLIGNAVKFVAPGVTPHIKIWAEEREGGAKTRLFFKDNGLGIDKEAHETIFGIFQRVNKNYEGTGIGLSIVKKGVERMGGAVGLESALGKAALSGWIWYDATANTEHLKPILYAEDDENDVFLMERAFRKTLLDYPLRTVPDGKLAVAYLAGEKRTRTGKKIHCLLSCSRPQHARQAWPRCAAMDSLSAKARAARYCLHFFNQESDIHRAYLLGAQALAVALRGPDPPGRGGRQARSHRPRRRPPGARRHQPRPGRGLRHPRSTAPPPPSGRPCSTSARASRPPATGTAPPPSASWSKAPAPGRPSTASGSTCPPATSSSPPPTRGTTTRTRPTSR